MGKVNGREDGDCKSPSGDVKEQDSMAEQDGAHGRYYAHGGDFMGQSPSPRPRASHSPIMFRHQIPVVTLQRPNEMNISSSSWMHYDMQNEDGIPIMFTWSHGGQEVLVEGSWDDWKIRTHLLRSGVDFTVVKVLRPGFYQYRFIVDQQLGYSPDNPWERDEAGNVFNILDLQPYVLEETDSISSFELPPSPVSSYNSLPFVEDYKKEPPSIPPHLQDTLLNAPSSEMEIPPPFARPQHVVLNHLYTHQDPTSPSVVALGSTNRFHSKYVTVVLYKQM